jgi:sugar lactone lactonase YvrE
MTMNLRLFALVGLLLLAVPATAQEATPELMPPMLDDGMLHEIVFSVPGLRPEGVEYDAVNGTFLVGSLSQGTIHRVMDDGAVTPFIEDAELTSTVGIHIDRTRNRLLVTNSDSSVFSDPNAPGRAGLAAYDLASGERLFYADLGALTPEGRQFANDVTVDAEGNAYVTNSFQPVIYRVSEAGEAAVLVQDMQLGNENFGLNGIDYVPRSGKSGEERGGFLLAAVSGAGALYKVTLDGAPTVTPVALSEPFGVDGMALDADGRLVAVAMTFDAGGASGQEVLTVRSEDNWATAVVGSRIPTDGNATTVALRGDAAYYINAYLDNTAQEQYEIVRVDL